MSLLFKREVGVYVFKHYFFLGLFCKNFKDSFLKFVTIFTES